MTDKSKKAGKDRKDQIAKASEEILKHQAGSADGETDETKVVEKAIGVDVGTSKIVIAQKGEGKVSFQSQFNAFMPVEYSKFSEGILQQNEISYYRSGDSLIVYGEGAEVFANMLNKETRRPMRNGLLNPMEENATDIIKAILDDLVVPSMGTDTQLCFSIPGVPNDAETDVIYHEAILKRHLTEKGYTVKRISEGLAVVLSELEGENFTGMGISAGGGMCNVCLAYLSIPLISFSINKGGDYIDNAVSSVTSEVTARVRKIKENELDLKRTPKNDIEDALHIYYDDLITHLVKALVESIKQTSKIPNFDRPIPMVLSGGSVKPEGFKERFETILNQEKFPLEISEIRLAGDPLTATANGALIAAMYED